jgi:parvulin-like peptidyl-prolyl isomerase
LRGLIESEVREEILFREALALGLDNGDTIVKRRLAQKMEFLAEDVAAIRDPAAAELRAWFEERKQQFTSPPRATFRHAFFSFDLRQARAEDDARGAQRRLASLQPASTAAAAAGDPFMFQSYYADRTPEQVGNVFGTKFAAALFALGPGAWQGPIESGYGWHVVWVDSIVPGRVPAFEEVEPDVKFEWIAEQRAAVKRKAFEAMQARYVVVLPAQR